MKPAPSVRIPRLIQSDYVEAKQVLGHEPKRPVGVVLSTQGFAELQAYGCKFPCSVAVDPTAHRDTCHWFWLPENFHPFTSLIRA